MTDMRIVIDVDKISPIPSVVRCLITIKCASCEEFVEIAKDVFPDVTSIAFDGTEICPLCGGRVVLDD